MHPGLWLRMYFYKLKYLRPILLLYKKITDNSVRCIFPAVVRLHFMNVRK